MMVSAFYGNSLPVNRREFWSSSRQFRQRFLSRRNGNTRIGKSYASFFLGNFQPFELELFSSTKRPGSLCIVFFAACYLQEAMIQCPVEIRPLPYFLAVAGACFL